MIMSKRNRRKLAIVCSAVILATLFPLSGLSFGLQARTGKIDLLVEHGSFDNADNFGVGKWWYPAGNNTATVEWAANEGMDASGALKFTRENSGQAFVCSQQISVVPGEEYTLTYHKKTSGKVQAYIQLRDPAASLVLHDTGVKEYTDWTQFTCSFVGPTSGKVRIDIGLNAGGGTAWFDNFSLVTAMETTGNYLHNGNFEQENHTANWYGISGNELAAIDTEGGREGGAALKIKNSGGSTVVYHSKIDASPNTTYTFSLWRKKDAPVQAYAQVFEFDADGGVLGAPPDGRNYLTGMGTAGDWEQYTFTHTTQSETASLRLQILANSGDGTAWFDDITITNSYKAMQIPASALKLKETKTENGASLFTFAIDGAELPRSGEAYVNAEPVQKLITQDYRYMFHATVDKVDRADVKLLIGNGTVTLRFADSDQSVYAVQKNAKKIVLPAGTTFLDPADVTKGFCLTETINMYRNNDGWSTACHHSYDSYQLAENATCTVKGSERLVCSLCGYEDTRDTEIDPTAHGASLKKIDAVAATCKAPGTIEHWHCDACGNDYSDADGTQKLASVVAEIDPTAHGASLKKIDAVAATHEKAGNILYYHCEACGKYFRDADATEGLAQADTVLPKGEHIYAEKWSVDTDSHWKECPCGSKTELGAHVFGEWKVTKQPTTTEKGERECICTVCGTAMREELPLVLEDTTDDSKNSDPDDVSPSTGEQVTFLISAFLLIAVAGVLLWIHRRKRV